MRLEDINIVGLDLQIWITNQNLIYNKLIGRNSAMPLPIIVLVLGLKVHFTRIFTLI